MLWSHFTVVLLLTWLNLTHTLWNLDVNECWPFLADSRSRMVSLQ